MRILRLQSSIELLLNYSFALLIIGVIITLLFFVGYSPKSLIPATCSSYAGLSCDFALAYSNASKLYSVYEFSFGNAESAPISIVGVNVMIGTVTSTISGCVPAYVPQGGKTTCIAMMPLTPPKGNIVNGYFSVNALFCSNNLGTISQTNCGKDYVKYGGAFSIQVQSNLQLIWSGREYLLPNNLESPAYQSDPTLVPPYTLSQQGAFVTDKKGFAFVTQGINTVLVGKTTVPVPNVFSKAYNPNIACSAPYNSTFVEAYTAFYSSVNGDYIANVIGDDPNEWYHATTGSLTGMNGAWIGTAANKLFTVPVSTGINYLAFGWSNACAGGYIAGNFIGIPG